MKKLLFTVLTLAFIATSTYAQLDTDKITTSKTAKQLLDEFSMMNFDVWITQSFKGKIKSNKMTLYEVEKTWMESPYPTDDIKPTYTEEDRGSVMYLYDEQSRLLKNSFKDDSRQLEYSIEYKYKGATNLPDQVSIREKVEDREVSTFANFNYNTENKLESIDIEKEGEDSDSFVLLYKYSEGGELIESVIKRNDFDKPKKNRVYEYENEKLVLILSPGKHDGENGKESLAIDCELSYDNKGRLTSIEKDEYDSSLQIIFDNAGNIRQEIQFENSTDTAKVTTFKYDHLNKEIARTEAEYHHTIEAVTLEDSDVDEEYDGPRRVYKQYLYHKTITEYENNILISVTKYEWDKDGNIQSIYKETAENEFDSHGNLIKQILRNSDDEIIEKIICEIEYY